MRLTWVEPRAYWLKRQEGTGWTLKTQTLYAFGLFAFAVLVRWGSSMQPAQRNNPVNWPVFISIAFPLCMLIGYGWPQAAKFLSSSNVIVSEKGINNNIQVGTMVRVQFWQWSSLGPVGEMQQEGHRLLIVRDLRGGVLAKLGIAPSIDSGQLKQSVLQCGGTWDDSAAVV